MMPGFEPRLPGWNSGAGPAVAPRQRRSIVRFVCAVLLATALMVIPSIRDDPDPGIGDVIVMVLVIAPVWVIVFLVLLGVRAAMAGVLARRTWRGSLAVVVLAALLTVAMHALWFAWGWSTFHPRCIEHGSQLAGADLDALGSGSDRRVELMGPLRPEAADLFEAAFVAAWGRDAVRRPSPGVVELRPALRLYATAELDARSVEVAKSDALHDAGSERSGLALCTPMALVLMEQGGARHNAGLSLWPYRLIDRNGDVARWLIRQSSGP